MLHIWRNCSKVCNGNRYSSWDISSCKNNFWLPVLAGSVLLWCYHGGSAENLCYLSSSGSNTDFCWHLNSSLCKPKSWINFNDSSKLVNHCLTGKLTTSSFHYSRMFSLQPLPLLTYNFLQYFLQLLRYEIVKTFSVYPQYTPLVTF